MAMMWGYAEVASSPMHVQIHSRSRISLHRLVPACPMTICASSGTPVLTRRGYTRTLREGQTVAIPAFEPVDIHLTGGLFSPSACRIAIDDAAMQSLDLHPGSACAHTQRALVLRDLVSGSVFSHPDRDWNANVLADVLRTTPGQVRNVLFRQGAALTDICRTQRLMRALFETCQANLTVADLKARVGWAGNGDLEGSFYNWFGVTLDTVARLREDAL